MRQEYVPSDVDEAEFEGNVNAPEGTSVAAMDEAMRRIEAASEVAHKSAEPVPVMPDSRIPMENGTSQDSSLVKPAPSLPKIPAEGLPPKMEPVVAFGCDPKRPPEPELDEYPADPKTDETPVRVSLL